MTTKTMGTLVLLLAPAALIYLAGYHEPAHYAAIGTVLAVQIGVLARPVAAFSILLPLVYVAAAITARSTDGVVALIVAIAAAVGASSSQGLHRGLMALVAAALIGSFEPAPAGEVLRRASFLLAGSSYGFLVAVTVLRGVVANPQQVDARAALGYAGLLAVLMLVAWFTARLAGFEHQWWLPLTVLAISQPVAAVAPRDALRRAALGMGACAALVFFTDSFDAPAARAVLLVAMLYVALAARDRHCCVFAMLTAPVLVLLSHHPVVHDPLLDYMRAALLAGLPVAAISVAGHWLLWMQRADPRRAAA